MILIRLQTNKYSRNQILLQASEEHMSVFFRMSQIVFLGYLLFKITFCDENF